MVCTKGLTKIKLKTPHADYLSTEVYKGQGEKGKNISYVVLGVERGKKDVLCFKPSTVTKKE